MTMVSTGPISLGGTGTSGGLNQSVNVELGRSGTATINMNETAVRTLAGVASGAISMNNFYGKSNAFTFNRTISANTQNYNLLNDMVANGYTNGGSFTANITINSGVYVWSDSTSIAGFDTGNITGTGTITIVNSGFIIGKGGNGQIPTTYDVNARTFNDPGGPAMNTVRPLTITNNSYIAGGGGSGGIAVRGYLNSNAVRGGSGGGAGGGNGSGFVFISSAGTITQSGVGGTGGGLGQSGSNGILYSANGAGTGGGGGRILPGVGGASQTVPSAPSNTTGAGGSGGGAGGNAGNPLAIAVTTGVGVAGLGGGAGGSGGGGRAGGKTGADASCGGGGGGWGALGGTGSQNTGNTNITGAGGAGGKAINTNGNAITFITTGTVYGAVN